MAQEITKSTLRRKDEEIHNTTLVDFGGCRWQNSVGAEFYQSWDTFEINKKQMTNGHLKMHRLTTYVTTHTCRRGHLTLWHILILPSGFFIFSFSFGAVLSLHRAKLQNEWKLNITRKKNGNEVTQMVKWSVEREKIGFKYLNIKPTRAFSLLQLQTRGEKNAKRL